jgi:hypothetical protein
VISACGVSSYEVIANAALLKPLENSFSKSFGSLLTGSGYNPEMGLFGALFGSTTTGPGGWSTTVTPSLFGFASGGSFEVGGSGGPDSQLVAFRASPNERVTIEAPGQRGRNDGGQTFVFNIAGDATDATVERMRRVAREEFTRGSPALVKQSVQAVGREYRADAGYLRR